MENHIRISRSDFGGVAVVVDGEELWAIKEYCCGSKKFYFFPLSPEQVDRYNSIIQRQAAESEFPEWRFDYRVLFMAVSEMLSACITPEGIHPDRKDYDAVQKEILALPFYFVSTLLASVQEAGEIAERGTGTP